MTKPVILRLSGLTKQFGSLIANDNIDLELHRGEVLALLGENGAGKTTLMNMLFGHYVPDEGRVEVAEMGADGQAEHMAVLPPGQPQAALEAGIGMVHQHFTLAENLTALDNILLGSEPLFSLRRNISSRRKKVEAIMERSGLHAPLNEPVGRLSVGERQRVEILKALYRDARILVLDEPTAVLTPQEADNLFANIREMIAGGLSVIFISHKLREVMAFADRIAVLRHGRKVGELMVEEADEKTIAELMVGAETLPAERKAVTPGPAVLSLRNIARRGATMRESLHDVSLDIRSGEITGIAGVSGNGQTALANIISGLARADSGSLEVGGVLIEMANPAAMLACRVGRIPEDRHHHGVISAMSVAENLVLERLDDEFVQKGGFLRKKSIEANATRLSEAFDIRGPGIHSRATLLSGGNIQKLILARVLDREPLVILANQPTRGLDFGATAEVGRRLVEARGRGAGILLISEDLDEILALSDRIFVMHDGQLTETDNRDRANIGLLMAGQAVC